MKSIKFVLIFIGIFLVLPVFAQTFNEEEAWKPALKRFIAAVKTDDPKKIGDFISYPLDRGKYIPPVKDKSDFIARYNDIFDGKLKAAISISDADRDSAEMWRGILFEPEGVNSTIWLDGDGNIAAMNYMSKKEMELEEKLIDQERTTVHESLRGFKYNATVIETGKFIIRIDYMKSSKMDGYIDYGDLRYASWNKPMTMQDKPNLVIKNGVIKYDGSGGNHYYVFKNGNYFYVCYINYMKEDEQSDANLYVYKTDKKINIDDFDLWDTEGRYEQILSAPADYYKGS